MAPATGAFGGAPYVATNRVRDVPTWTGGERGETHANFVTGAFGGAPYGATKRCTGRAEMDMRWAAETHVDPATGAFGGAPYGATNRVRCVPKWSRGGRGTACGRGRWGLRWRSLWGHEPWEGCAKMCLETNVNPAAGAFGGAFNGPRTV